LAGVFRVGNLIIHVIAKITQVKPNDIHSVLGVGLDDRLVVPQEVDLEASLADGVELKGGPAGAITSVKIGLVSLVHPLQFTDSVGPLLVVVVDHRDLRVGEGVVYPPVLPGLVGVRKVQYSGRTQINP